MSIGNLPSPLCYFPQAYLLEKVEKDFCDIPHFRKKIKWDPRKIKVTLIVDTASLNALERTTSKAHQTPPQPLREPAHGPPTPSLCKKNTYTTGRSKLF